MRKDTLIVIPARYASVRFPAKILALLGGKPVLEYVYAACKKADIGEVIIAIDHKNTAVAAKKMGAKFIMTDPDLPSGTDRVYQASKNLKAKYIINVQADEPFVKPETLKLLIAKLKKSGADIATPYSLLTDKKEINNSNCVKIALGKNDRALYFSRCPIPYHHPLSELKSIPYCKHHGIYGYTKPALKKFVKLPLDPLEKLERLEQLRALSAGMTIAGVEVPFETIAIDTPKDLAKAEKFLKKSGAENV